jgi:hypothetical protein
VKTVTGTLFNALQGGRPYISKFSGINNEF